MSSLYAYPIRGAKECPKRCPFDDTALTMTASDENELHEYRIVRVHCSRCGYAARPAADGMWVREDPYALGFGVWLLAFVFAVGVAFVIAWSHVNFGFP